MLFSLRYKLLLHEATEMVNQKRPSMELHRGAWEQLGRLERRLFPFQHMPQFPNITSMLEPLLA